MSIKSQNESYTVMTEIVIQSYVNGTGRLFGGQLMSWMDICGAIAAKRHANYDVVTARVEKMDFLRPARPNDIVIVKSKVVSVGNTSMKVDVQAEVEFYKDGEKNTLEICEAIFTYVAINKEEQKQVVPKLKIQD